MIVPSVVQSAFEKAATPRKLLEPSITNDHSLERVALSEFVEGTRLGDIEAVSDVMVGGELAESEVERSHVSLAFGFRAAICATRSSRMSNSKDAIFRMLCSIKQVSFAVRSRIVR